MMRTLKKFTTAALLVVMTTGGALMFNGCTNSTPFAPQEPISEQQQLNFIPLTRGDTPATLSKIVTVTEWVTYQRGGRLTLKHRVPQADGPDTQVMIQLNIRPRTISQDSEVSLSLDDENLGGNVDLQFGPSGTTFSRPALLNVHAEGLDLTGVNPDKVDIYYYNPDTGEWEPLNRRAVVVRPERGLVKVIGAELNHFSRYAVAWGD